MKWPQWLSRESPPVAEPDRGGEDAHREAAEHLAAATEQWPEVRRVALSLRELRERNHFRDQIELIFQGGGRER